jgi:hypothetical protein
MEETIFTETGKARQMKSKVKSVVIIPGRPYGQFHLLL